LTVALAAGCGGRAGEPTTLALTDAGVDALPRGVFVEVRTWSLDRNPPIDVLFMVDGSSSMEPAQATLKAALPRFINVLTGGSDGAPDLHIAVVTADMGIGNSDIPGCSAAGGGVFRFPGTAGGCGLVSATDTYIRSSGGTAPQNNFTGDLATVLGCMVQVGGTGCGFEQQLRSIARALGADGFAPPAENQGFLRPDANLVVVLLSNEDDCSAVTDSFYDVQSNSNLASPLGPPGNFRCSEFGHLCGGDAPARRAPYGQLTDLVT
jgi:hypothetical protein